MGRSSVTRILAMQGRLGDATPIVPAVLMENSPLVEPKPKQKKAALKIIKNDGLPTDPDPTAA